MAPDTPVHAPPALTADEAIARARALAPIVRERSARTNEARRLPDETMADLVRSGLFRVMQPRRYGGVELGLEVMVRASLELSRGCGSAGWVYSVIGIHQWLIGMFPDEAQRDMWGPDPDATAASSFSPTGNVTPTQGGFRLDGAWSFCSGCDVTSWIFVAGFLGMHGTPPRPDLRIFLVPMSDCTIDDNWHVLGLCGTGSKNVVMKDVFVPEHRVLDFLAAKEGMTPGAEVNPSPLFRLPAWAYFPLCLSAPAVGAAAGALERFLAETAAKRTRHGGAPVAQFATTQLHVAEAAAALDAAELLLIRDARDAMETANAGKKPELLVRARARRDQAYATQLACKAIETLFRTAGGLAVFDGSELQRAYRDVNAAAAHIGNNWDMAGTQYGTAALGLPLLEGWV